MKYYMGLKVRFFITFLVLLTVMFNCACMGSYYGTPIVDSYYWLCVVLNIFVEILLTIYLVILKRKIETYEEKHHISK